MAEVAVEFVASASRRLFAVGAGVTGQVGVAAGVGVGFAVGVAVKPSFSAKRRISLVWVLAAIGLS
jgi:hypothetical protein